MYSEFLGKSDLLVWPIVALVIFFTVFVGVIARMVLQHRRGEQLDRISSLPLEPDSSVSSPGEKGA